MSNILSWLWLSTKLPPCSPYSDILLEHFSHNADKIYNAGYDDYLLIDGLKSNYIDSLTDKSLKEAENILDWCTQNNVGILTYDNKFYPQRLRNIEKAPVVLYYKGKLINFDDNVCIAMVGTRRMTDYGKREGYRIARDLGLGGAVVVSGMARGVDTICHRGALDAGAYTIAVLGCGIDRAYPSENKYIMNEISQSGLVISEFKPFTPPLGSNFPMRNRIITGLSLGTLVIEADAKSGAMISAKHALKQGRDIFSLPGNVGEYGSVGPNMLLKSGAKIVTNALDILSEYEYLYPHRIRIENLPAFIPRFTPSHQSGRTRFASPKKEIIPDTPMETALELSPLKDTQSEITKKSKTPSTKKEIPVEAEKKPKKIRDTSTLSEDEKKIYSLFSDSAPISADELSRSGFSVGTVLQTLTMLEIKGFISALPGGMYTKS